MYVVSFFQGLIFWFAVEKVFMVHIGFSTFLITISVVLISIVTLITEIPLGILADRWGRKNVLVVSMAALCMAAITMGFATAPMQYLLGTVFVAISSAAYSGLFDSMIYDTLKEVQGSRRRYEHYFGLTKIATSAAWVIGSLLGVVVASRYGLSAAYIFSIPSCVLGLFSALLVKEPSVHGQADESATYYLLRRHIKATLRAVLATSTARWNIFAMVLVAIPTLFLMELDQLWPIALALPLLWYGPLNALLLAGSGVGGYVAGHFTSKKWLLWGAVIFGTVSLFLLSVHHIAAVVIGQFGTLSMFTALSVIANGKMHDEIPSFVRSGASSIVSTVTTLCFLPIVLIFGKIVESSSVFTASFIIMPFGIIGAILLVRNFWLGSTNPDEA